MTYKSGDKMNDEKNNEIVYLFVGDLLLLFFFVLLISNTAKA